MKPCAILYRNARFEAYNEDGRMILARSTELECKEACVYYDYFVATPTSYIGRYILWLMAHKQLSPLCDTQRARL